MVCFSEKPLPFDEGGNNDKAEKLTKAPAT